MSIFYWTIDMGALLSLLALQPIRNRTGAGNIQLSLSIALLWAVMLSPPSYAQRYDGDRLSISLGMGHSLYLGDNEASPLNFNGDLYRQTWAPLSKSITIDRFTPGKVGLSFSYSSATHPLLRQFSEGDAHRVLDPIQTKPKRQYFKVATFSSGLYFPSLEITNNLSARVGVGIHYSFGKGPALESGSEESFRVAGPSMYLDLERRINSSFAVYSKMYAHYTFGGTGIDGVDNSTKLGRIDMSGAVEWGVRFNIFNKTYDSIHPGDRFSLSQTSFQPEAFVLSSPVFVKTDSIESLLGRHVPILLASEDRGLQPPDIEGTCLIDITHNGKEYDRICLDTFVDNISIFYELRRHTIRTSVVGNRIRNVFDINMAGRLWGDFEDWTAIINPLLPFMDWDVCFNATGPFTLVASPRINSDWYINFDYAVDLSLDDNDAARFKIGPLTWPFKIQLEKHKPHMLRGARVQIDNGIEGAANTIKNAIRNNWAKFYGEDISIKIDSATIAAQVITSPVTLGLSQAYQANAARNLIRADVEMKAMPNIVLSNNREYLAPSPILSNNYQSYPKDAFSGDVSIQVDYSYVDSLLSEMFGDRRLYQSPDSSTWISLSEPVVYPAGSNLGISAEISYRHRFMGLIKGRVIANVVVVPEPDSLSPSVKVTEVDVHSSNVFLNLGYGFIAEKTKRSLGQQASSAIANAFTLILSQAHTKEFRGLIGRAQVNTFRLRSLQYLEKGVYATFHVSGEPMVSY
ncbi:DUF4403 family protein [Rhodothermus sp. AH-315-K08]|nr:DUF4403 family protein [Rhodothermus sp. AH-315-K08]